MRDSGHAVWICTLATLAFWFIASAITLRRPQKPTRGELFLIRWAFLPIFCVAFLVAT